MPQYPAAATPDHTVRIVAMDGTVIQELTNANVVSYRQGLNGAGESGVFTFPRYDPDANGQGANVVMLREVQFLEGATVVFWGVMVSASCGPDDSAVTVQCAGLNWYFSRRFVDRARTNLLDNPEFEDDLDFWTSSGTTASAVSSPRRLGAQSAQLVQASTGVDTHLHQSFSHTGSTIGDLIIVAAWFYIDSWSGAAIDARGLYVEGDDGSDIRDVQFFRIDDSTPRDTWQRAETAIWVPPGETWTIDVRLYSIGGTIIWDATQAVLMESIGLFGGDVAALAEDVVLYLQDSTYKSDLNIGVDCPNIGVTLPVKFWQFAEHARGDTALGELETYLDWWIDYDATTRTFHTAAQRGSDLTGSVELTPDHEDVIAIGLGKDATVTESRTTVYGDGDGPDREEATVTETSALPDGLILEGVYAAPPGTEIDHLHAKATELNVQKNHVLTLPSVAVTLGSTTDTAVGVGDTISFDIYDGWADAVGDFRVFSRDVAPAARTVTYELREAV